MEELRGRGRHDHLDVVLGAKLQVALEPRRGVLRALAFVAVRQVHRERAQAPPLRLAGGDELVDHHLGAVGEVAELRFPDHQLEGVRRRVAVLEAEHRLLRQERIDHEEVGLAFADVLQRKVDARIPLLAVLVVQHRVAVGEGAAAAVLPRQAHRVALVDQRRVGEVLRHAPVERSLPRPISRRAPSMRSTVGCSLKFGGMSVSRTASAFSFSIGTEVSAARRHSTPM